MEWFAFDWKECEARSCHMCSICFSVISKKSDYLYDGKTFIGRNFQRFWHVHVTLNALIDMDIKPSFVSEKCRTRKGTTSEHNEKWQVTDVLNESKGYFAQKVLVGKDYFAKGPFDNERNIRNKMPDFVSARVYILKRSLLQYFYKSQSPIKMCQVKQWSNLCKWEVFVNHTIHSQCFRK